MPLLFFQSCFTAEFEFVSYLKFASLIKLFTCVLQYFETICVVYSATEIKVTIVLLL